MVSTIIPCFLTGFESCIMTFLVADSWSHLALTVISWFGATSCREPIAALETVCCWYKASRCGASVGNTLVYLLLVAYFDSFTGLLCFSIVSNAAFHSGLKQTVFCTPEEMVCRLQVKYLSVPFFYRGCIFYVTHYVTLFTLLLIFTT